MVLNQNLYGNQPSGASCVVLGDRKNTWPTDDIAPVRSAFKAQTVPDIAFDDDFGGGIT